MIPLKFISTLAICGAFAAPALAQDGTTPIPPKLSLEDSIAMALKNSTTVLKAQTDKDLSGTAVLQSYLQFMPNLVGQAGYGYNKGVTFLTSSVPTLVNASSYGPSYGVSTTLNIFNGFSDMASWSAAHDRRNAADKTLFRAKQQISLDITQSFLQAVLDQKLVLIAEKNLKASTDRQTLLQEQTTVGLRNKADLFRQQAQTSSDESFLISVQNKSEADMIILLRKLRIDPSQVYQLVEPPLEQQVAELEKSYQKLVEDEAIRQALNNRSDYQVAKLNESATQHDVTATRAGYMPKIDFVASYLTSARNWDYNYVNNVSSLPATSPSFNDQLNNYGSYNYGVVLTWTIFDRWSNAYGVEKAKATAYKARLDSEDFRNQVIGEMKQAIIDYQAASQQLQASQRGLVAAQKAFEVTTGRYEVGSLSYIDLATAQTALVQAEATRAQSLIGYELAKRSVDFALGTTPTE